MKMVRCCNLKFYYSWYILLLVCLENDYSTIFYDNSFWNYFRWKILNRYKPYSFRPETTVIKNNINKSKEISS